MYLRRFRADEAQLLFELDSDPEVMRLISKGQPTSMSRIQNDILPRFLAYYAQSPPRGFWAGHFLSNNEFIGWFHLRPDKIDKEEMELGYRLRRAAWGQGLATEGSRALVEGAFEKWNYPKVSARTLALNKASQRVMEKAGLKFEREFFWSAEVLPEWSEEERRGVKFALASDEYRRAGTQT